MASAPVQRVDLPPLFPLGFHRLTMDQVEQVCIDLFPLSTHRPAILAGLQTFMTRLRMAAISGEVWLDGSFLTEKTEPNDVDVILRVDGLVYDAGTFEQRAAIDWVIRNQKLAHKCDSYVFFDYPFGHPLYNEGQWWYSYWHRQWGFGRDGEPKGIVVLPLGTGERT